MQHREIIMTPTGHRAAELALHLSETQAERDDMKAPRAAVTASASAKDATGSSSPGGEVTHTAPKKRGK